MPADAPAPTFFESPEAFGAWLDEHGAAEPELWVGYWKQGRGRPVPMTWSQAVDEALCRGWIDTQVRRIDDDRHMQRFTPRRPGSNWSAVNVRKVGELIAAGRMRPAGLAAWQARREDRTAQYSYEREPLPLAPEYEARIRADAAAWAWWSARAPSYRRAADWVMRAKGEVTRERRIAALVEDCAAGQVIKPGRYGRAAT
jgi:uncharacterized protein YdeI (YjbR/CyaY-like superfamily)